MTALSAFEWRVLRDLSKDNRVERGAATNQALETLKSSGYIIASESHRKLVTAKGLAELALGEPNGEPVGKGSYGDLDFPAPNHFDPSKRGFMPK